MTRGPRRFARLRCALLLAVAAAGAACGRRGDDPGLAALGGLLAIGDRVLLLRALDSEGRLAVVLTPRGGPPELRVYEKRGGGHALAYVTRQGDLFRNLTIEDVNGDGKDEILSTWTGGHLEILEIVERRDDGSWASVFQNAGREIERRVGPAGTAEFWITSRTYDEGPGQAQAYDTTVYAWADGAFKPRGPE